MGNTWNRLTGALWDLAFVPPISADIATDDSETECLRNLNFTIHTYYRYVDDIFLIIPVTKQDLLSTTFNKITVLGRSRRSTKLKTTIV